MKKLSHLIALLAAGALAVPQAQAATEWLVNGALDGVNGNFKTPDNWTAVMPPNNSAANQTNLYVLNEVPANASGWAWPTGNASGGDIFQVYRSIYYNQPDKTQGLSQAVNGLIIGDTYQLSFLTAANSTFQEGPASWTVNFLGQTKTGTAASPGISDNRYCPGGGANCTGPGGQVSSSWVKSTMTFVANSSSSVLQLTANMPAPRSDPYSYNIFLDGLSLTDLTHPDASPVPEPSRAALTLAALASVGLVLRRRGLSRKA